MRIKQSKPQHAYVEAERAHVWKIPSVTTSGHPASPYEYNNCVYAAVFALLAALRCDTKQDVLHWLETAEVQLADGIAAINKPYAEVVLAPEAQKEAK